MRSFYIPLFLRKDLLIARNIKHFVLFKSCCCIKVKQSFYEACSPVICSCCYQGLRPGGEQGIAGQMSGGYIYIVHTLCGNSRN